MSEVLRLPGPVVLAPGRQLAVKFADVRRQYPHVPDLDVLIAELNRLAAAGGVPVSLERTPWLRLYTARAFIGLRPSPRADAWLIEFIEPLRLRDHATIARGLPRVAPRAWHYQDILAQLPPGYSSFREQIEHAWRSRSTTTTAAAGSTPAKYGEFCDDLDAVIEAGRQIDSAKQRQAAPIPYYAVESAAAQRRTAAGVYVFRLARPGRIERGTLVELRGAADLQGTVRQVDGDRLTVGFAGTVDRRRIGEQGELIVSVNPVVPRVQSSAVRTLRDGESVNPRLPTLVVDGAFAAYPPAAPDEVPAPAEPLDPDQAVAFRRALAGPDMLLVLGPPGTGKTRTIVQIAGACAARGERVLIASHTNTAVDNVLERLPAQVRGLRVGNDERIASSVRHLTLPELAEALRQQILDRTAGNAAALDPWLSTPSPAQAWLTQLERSLSETHQARAHRVAAENQHRTELQRVYAGYASRMAAAESNATSARHAHEEAARRVERHTTKLARARRRADGLLGFIYRSAARRHTQRLAAAERDYTIAGQALNAAVGDLAAIRAELRDASERDPQVIRTRQHIDLADQAIARSIEAATSAAGQLHRMLAAALPPASATGTAPPPASATGTASAGVSIPGRAPHDLDGLVAFHRWCQQVQPLVRARAALLHDWRTKLGEPTVDLNHELVRYADVVGATCIGVAIGSNLIADLDFDVAIIDEAGQISLPSALVPLVRARRAILVGDHHQLPPFVDDEVREWLARRTSGNGNGTEPGRLTELLTASAFERLYRVAPETHRVLLRSQRRMPAAIADFVSAQFYDYQLRTEGSRPAPPPPFRKPLAIVDTSDVAPAKRAERRRERTETWQTAGCDNPEEARIIIDLVQWYASLGCSWAVIVPYRAQVQLIAARLSSMLGDETLVSDNVGSVDAFQGGERDIICYGFTRSNPSGQVGFLKELRRINVAITRARQQLVLVGDFATLRAARDTNLRDLIHALERHAGQYGERHPSQQLPDLLRDAWQMTHG